MTIPDNTPRLLHPASCILHFFVAALCALATMNTPVLAEGAFINPSTAPATIVPPATVPPPATLPPMVLPPPAPIPPRPMTWTRLNFALPPSIKIYEGSAVVEGGYPIKAWYADIDYSDRSLLARPLLSQTSTGKELASAMAQKVGAYVAINGGYFDMAGSPTRTYSLVKSGGRVLSQNIARVLRAGKPYYVTRSALGIRSNRTFDIAWIAHFGNDIYQFPTPAPNTVLLPAPVPSPTYPAGGSAWSNVTDAIGGGPTLISRGQIRNTYEEEVFFGSGFSSDQPYPRAAAGYTANNHLILFVVDGKQPLHSVGLTLPQLAEEMRKIGCVEAMNLDGGGSATLVVNGVVINTPSDVINPIPAISADGVLIPPVRGKERRVTSILAIVPASVQANRMSRE